jgi:hypothetical protein
LELSNKEYIDVTSSKQLSSRRYSEYIHANDLGFLEGNIVKYITRHRAKGEGAMDIYKVKHYADLILQYHYDLTEEDGILLSQESTND